MIPKIAIHGRKNQPKLVINYLTKLGGINETNWSGDDIKGFYWIDDLKKIRCTDYIPEGYNFIDDWCKRVDKPIGIKYILVRWPESQYFIGIENCYYINPMGDINLDQAMFVPEETYNKIMNN